jgi:hypothetical protein
MGVRVGVLSPIQPRGHVGGAACLPGVGLGAQASEVRRDVALIRLTDVAQYLTARVQLVNPLGKEAT